MWMPDGPLPGLSWLSVDGRVCGGWTSCLRLCLVRTLLLELVYLPYPLVYGAGIVERDAGALRQVDGSPGVPGGGNHPALDAPMMPCPGVDFSHGPVAHGLRIVLALYGDTLAPRVHDDVDALIPCSPTHHRPMSHCPEESATKTSNWAPSIERTASKRRESSRAVGVVGLFNRCQATHTPATIVPMRRAAPRSIPTTFDQSDVVAPHE